MRSVEVSTTLNANKINQGIRYFYEPLNTDVHNIMSHVSICIVFFSMLYQQTLNGPGLLYRNWLLPVCILLYNLCRLNCRTN